VRRRLRSLLQRLHVLPALSEQFDQWAEWLVTTRFEGTSEAELAEMLSHLSEFRDRVLGNARIRPGETVVDVGAGTGLLTVGAAERVAPDGDVLAVDLSVDALEELRRVCSAPNVFYLVGSADVLPFPDEWVDAVLTRSVLIYVQDKAEAAREFFRVLRSGGRISIFEPINNGNTRLSEVVDFGELHAHVAEWERERYEDPDDSMLNFDEHDLQRLFREAGFVDVAAELETGTSRMSAERTMNVVGAPGRLSLLAEWTERFPPHVVERLAALIQAQGEITRDWPQLYLVAAKP
jgi:arsenite methyltransferase